MRNARSFSELEESVSSAAKIVNTGLPLLMSTTAEPVTETARVDRLNMRREAFRLVLAELLDNEYE